MPTSMSALLLPLWLGIFSSVLVPAPYRPEGNPVLVCCPCDVGQRQGSCPDIYMNALSSKLDFVKQTIAKLLSYKNTGTTIQKPAPIPIRLGIPGVHHTRKYSQILRIGCEASESGKEL
jgi:hypothetical protein